MEKGRIGIEFGIKGDVVKWTKSFLSIYKSSLGRQQHRLHINDLKAKKFIFAEVGPPLSTRMVQLINIVQATLSNKGNENWPSYVLGLTSSKI